MRRNQRQSRRRRQVSSSSIRVEDEIAVGTDTNGATTSYSCARDDGLSESGDDEGNVVSIEHYYDLLYPCAMENPNVGVRYITEQLLLQTAESWNLFPGVATSTCTDPFFHLNIWLRGVEYVDHRLVTEFPCQQLQPLPDDDDACCTVVRLDMRFAASGLYYGNVLHNAMDTFVKKQLNFRQTSSTVPLRTASIQPPAGFYFNNNNNQYYPTTTTTTSSSVSTRPIAPTQTTTQSVESPPPYFHHQQPPSGSTTTTSASPEGRSVWHRVGNFFATASVTHLSLMGALSLLVSLVFATSFFLLTQRRRKRRQRGRQRAVLPDAALPVDGNEEDDDDGNDDDEEEEDGLMMMMMMAPCKKKKNKNCGTDTEQHSSPHSPATTQSSTSAASSFAPTMTEQMLDCLDRQTKSTLLLDDSMRSTSATFMAGMQPHTTTPPREGVDDNNDLGQQNEQEDDDDDKDVSFTFDLGLAFRSGLFMGGMANNNNNNTEDPEGGGGEDDTVDSWAQTDGTVGSLDIRLEAITAEI